MIANLAASAVQRQWLLRVMPGVFVFIWSTGFVVARFAMPHSPPFSFLVLRYALSLTCFGVWIVWARVEWPRTNEQWLHLAVVGLLLHAGYLGAVWAAVRAGIGAGTVALVVGLQPVLTALWISGVASRRVGLRSSSVVSARQWLGLVMGLGGLTLVVQHKIGAGEINALNLGLALTGLLSITIGTLYQKRFVAACDVRSASAVQLLAALVVSLPLAALEPESLTWHPHLIGALVWSVLALTLGGSSLLYLMIQRGAATRVTSLMYLVPASTAVLAWIMFDEALTASMLAGMAMTVGGVALIVRAAVR